MRQRRNPYFGPLWVGGLIAIVVFSLGESQGHELTRRFSDAFFVAGVMLLGSGGLVFCTNHGALNAMGYGVKTLANTFLPWAFSKDSDFGKKETYWEYTQRKAENRKSPKALLLCGCAYMALALMATVIHSLMT